MFQQILVPLDGSSPAEQSLPWAARIARTAPASLIFLRVVTSPSTSSLYEAEQSTSLTAELDAQRAEAMRYLQMLTRRQEFAGLDVKPLVSSGPLATDEILAAARTQQADLIVLSTHLHTDRTRWLQASVAQNVIRLADAPVLVVHEQPVVAGAEGDVPQLPKHVRSLVTLDGSPCAEGALRPAMDLALALAGTDRPQLRLLRVVESASQIDRATPSVDDRVTQATEREADTEVAGAYLAGIMERMRNDPRAAMVEITWSVASALNPVEVILREVGECDDDDIDQNEPSPRTMPVCNVVAMTTHGQGGIRPWSLGSTTDRVLHLSAAPLLVARPLAP